MPMGELLDTRSSDYRVFQLFTHYLSTFYPLISPGLRKSPWTKRAWGQRSCRVRILPTFSGVLSPARRLPRDFAHQSKTPLMNRANETGLPERSSPSRSSRPIGTLVVNLGKCSRRETSSGVTRPSGVRPRRSLYHFTSHHSS